MRPYGAVVDAILLAYLSNSITILWFEVVELWDWLLLLSFRFFAKHKVGFQFRTFDTNEMLPKIRRIAHFAGYF